MDRWIGEVHDIQLIVTNIEELQNASNTERSVFSSVE